MELIIKEKPRFNYTQGAWEGQNYDGNLDISEIAKRVRTGLKIKYPKSKFSVTIERYAGGQSMGIKLVQTDKNPFKVLTEDDLWNLMYRGGLNRSKEEVMENYNNTVTKGHHGINNYYIKEDSYLTDEAKEMFIFVCKFVNSFNYDDSDSMIDYFNTNFYTNFGIGKWNKALIIKE